MSRGPNGDPTSIGWLAKIFCGVSDALLGEALHEQKDAPAKPLGQVLVDMQAVTTDQLDDLLQRQQALRDGTGSAADVAQVLTTAVDDATAISQRLVALAREAKKDGDP